MSEWEKVDWTYIKHMYSRYIGIEIDGKFYLVDLMPCFTGLLSIPKIHRWQRLPVYQAKNDESQEVMRKLKFSKAMVEKGIRKQEAGYAFAVIGFVFLRYLLKPWVDRYMNKMIIPGVLGIVIAILGYLATYFLINFFFYGSQTRREVQTYELAPFRISIRYKQKFSDKLDILGLLMVAIMLFPAIYFGIIEPLVLAFWAFLFAGLTRMIPPKTEIWYKIRPHK